MKVILNKKHALKLSREYTQANFTWIISLILTVVLLLNSFDFKEGELKGSVFSVFASLCVFHYLSNYHHMDGEARPSDNRGNSEFDKKARLCTAVQYSDGKYFYL